MLTKINVIRRVCTRQNVTVFVYKRKMLFGEFNTRQNVTVLVYNRKMLLGEFYTRQNVTVLVYKRATLQFSWRSFHHPISDIVLLILLQPSTQTFIEYVYI